MPRKPKKEETIELTNQDVTNTNLELGNPTKSTKHSVNNSVIDDVIIPSYEEKEDTPIVNQKEENTYKGVTRYFDVSKDTGLTDEIVQDRINAELVNVSNIKTTKSSWKIICDNLFTFFNILYVFITILLIIAGSSITNFFYIIVVIFNTTMSIIQEFKAKKMVEKLSLVSAAKAKVVRNGVQKEILNTEVVLDDVVFFTNGNQIYTDSILIDGFVEVNESMITGESDSIVKNPGDMLYSGSYVVSGSAYARVEHVGKENYIEKLAIEAKQQKAKKSELLRTLNLIVKIVGFIIIPLFILEFLQVYCNFDLSSLSIDVTSDRFKDAVQSVSGSVVGMIPAGLFLLTTVALTQGVFKLGKKYNTSVQELYCIEMLARVDTLCLDKTGTITDGTMRVVDCIEVKNTTDYSIREIVGSMMEAFNDKNATSEAITRFFSKNKVLKPTAILPFSSKRKFSAVTFNDAGTFYLGAPEFILIDNYEKVKAKVEKYATQGCRVVALGHTATGIKKEGIASNVKPIALIVIQDHIRDEAYETIQFFKENGVDVKVISGDNPVTVSEIAHRVGISNYNRYISLEGLTDEEVKEVAFDYTIFGRVTPNQKKALVEAFKAQKRTVAMTGDGVNDILALKEADCSVAMASGSEATRNIANIVLMDSNFASMPQVVAEGRRVINNVQRTSTLFLTKTLLIFFISIMYLIAKKPYPFTTSQMVLIEMVIIGFPSTVISLLPNKERVKGKFILNVLKSALPGALTVLIFHLVVYLMDFEGTEKISFLIDKGIQISSINGTYSTVLLIITTFVSISVLYRMCKPFNLVRTIVFLISLIVTTVCILVAKDVSVINSFLNISELDSSAWLFLIVCLLLINPILTIFERVINKFSKLKIFE